MVLQGFWIRVAFLSERVFADFELPIPIFIRQPNLPPAHHEGAGTGYDAVSYGGVVEVY